MLLSLLAGRSVKVGSAIFFFFVVVTIIVVADDDDSDSAAKKSTFQVCARRGKQPASTCIDRTGVRFCALMMGRLKRTCLEYYDVSGSSQFGSRERSMEKRTTVRR